MRRSTTPPSPSPLPTPAPPAAVATISHSHRYVCHRYTHAYIYTHTHTYTRTHTHTPTHTHQVCIQVSVCEVDQVVDKRHSVSSFGRMSHMSTTHAPYHVQNSSLCQRCKANSNSELQHLLNIWCFVKLLVFQKETKWALVSLSTQNGSLFNSKKAFFLSTGTSSVRPKCLRSEFWRTRIFRCCVIQMCGVGCMKHLCVHTYVCVFAGVCIYLPLYISIIYVTCAYVYLQVCTYIYVRTFPFRSIVLVERGVAHKNIEVLGDLIVGCTLYLYIYCCRYIYACVYI